MAGPLDQRSRLNALSALHIALVVVTSLVDG